MEGRHKQIMEQGDPAYLGQRSAECAALARQVRQRARIDLLLVAIATAGASLLGSTSHEAVLAGSSALSLGILGYVVRRDRDLVALAASSRWRESAVEGRGMTLRQWRSGAPLKAWTARRGEPVETSA
ncbi:MAG: hypothetical protein ACRC1J_01590 [Sandaracinobacteroides sp.]